MQIEQIIQNAENSSFGLWWLNFLLARLIPFNKPHSIKVIKISKSEIQTNIPYKKKNLNHIKGIHACGLATAAEFASGLLLLYNLGFKEASNNIVCFLDIDCLVSIDSLIKSISIAKKDWMVIGYNRTAIYIEHPLKAKIKDKKGMQIYKFLESHIEEGSLETGWYDKQKYSVGNTNAVGGCLFGSKAMFKKINCFNPNFIGWGYEDNEIIARAGIMGVTVAGAGNSNTNWLLFHLPHEEGGVAIKDKDKHEYYNHNYKELKKVLDMDKLQLEQYIKSW